MIAPHSGAGGATVYGLKITEQGLNGINIKKPTESFDIGGTVRVRNLPVNGATNAIFTTATGNSSIPATATIQEMQPIQTFTGTRTVIANNQGVLGYVSGIPVTKNAQGYVIIENLPVFENNAAATSLTTGTIYRTSDGTLKVKY